MKLAPRIGKKKAVEILRRSLCGLFLHIHKGKLICSIQRRVYKY